MVHGFSMEGKRVTVVVYVIRPSPRHRTVEFCEAGEKKLGMKAKGRNGANREKGEKAGIAGTAGRG
jgi:hypothetical protein